MSLKLIIWLLNKGGKNIYFRKGRKPRELVQKFLYPRTKNQGTNRWFTGTWVVPEKDLHVIKGFPFPDSWNNVMKYCFMKILLYDNISSAFWTYSLIFFFSFIIINTRVSLNPTSIQLKLKMCCFQYA